MPWDDAAIGGGVAVSALLSLLKRLGLPASAARPVSWLAGFIWLVLARLAGGEDWAKSLIGGAVVVLSAPGFYEMVSKPAARKRQAGTKKGSK